MDKDEFYTACLESEKILKLIDVYDEEKRVHVYENIWGGTLADLIKKNIQNDQKLPLEDVLLIMYQLVDILDFLRSYGITFKNLKPESIVFTEENNLASLKIYNFEFASWRDMEPLLGRNWKYVENNAARILTLERVLSNTFEDDQSILSIKYSAPELIMKRDYSEKADIWSLGIIFYLMLTNQHPLEYLSKYWDMKNLNQAAIAKLEWSGANNFIDFNAECLREVPESLLILLTRMLQVNPDERISIQEKSKIQYILSNEFVLQRKESLDQNDGQEEMNENKMQLVKISSEASFTEWMTSGSTLNTSRDEEKSVSPKLKNLWNATPKMDTFNSPCIKLQSTEDLDDLSNIFDSFDFEKSSKIRREDAEYVRQAIMKSNQNYSKNNTWHHFSPIQNIINKLQYKLIFLIIITLKQMKKLNILKIYQSLFKGRNQKKNDWFY